MINIGTFLLFLIGAIMAFVGMSGMAYILLTYRRISRKPIQKNHPRKAVYFD